MICGSTLSGVGAVSPRSEFNYKYPMIVSN